MPNQKKPAIRSFFFHSLWLALVIFGLWIWTNSPFLSQFNFYLAICIVTCYLLVRFFCSSYILDTIIYTVALLLIVASTGGLGSSFFFLIYFLLFAIALIFEPFLTLSLALGLAIFFSNHLNSLHAVLQILSLFLFSFLALVFGKQYLRLLEAQKKIKVLIKKEYKMEKEIETQETDSLFWLSLDFKNSLLAIIHQAGELLADNRLPLGKTGRDSLQSIHKTAKSLLESGKKLQEKIDKETD